MALFERPDFQSALAEAHKRRELASTRGPDVASLIAEREAEHDEVEKLRASGELTLRAYAAETKRIEDAIEDLRGQQVAAVSSPALRRLLNAATLQDGWRQADLMDQREVVRLLLDVTIRRAVVRGRKFDPGRVTVEPSADLRQDARGSEDVPVALRAILAVPTSTVSTANRFRAPYQAAWNGTDGKQQIQESIGDPLRQGREALSDLDAAVGGVVGHAVLPYVR